jgi:methyl-accepting chemotaxis protein
MKNLKVKSKMLILVLSIFITIIISGIFAVTNLQQASRDSIDILDSTIRKEYDNNIKEQVVNVISLLNSIYEDYQEGSFSLEEAKELSADLVRDMRYKDGGYFWVDTIEGDNVVFLGNATEGTNRIDTKDANGYEMVREIIRIGQEPEGGFTDYIFPKEGETESSPKRGYSKLFEPFGWVVGTGNYTDFIDDIIADQTEIELASIKEIAVYFIVILLLLLAAIGFIAIWISLSISGSVKVAMNFLDPISAGDFTQELPKKLVKR